MFHEVVTSTNILFYFMIAVGAIGVLAKAVNQITLRCLVKAAGNMQKSTHKLIKLIRAKYEHALMLHDKVENAEVFVEKYIYEYRGILLRIHTWRQLEVQSIWFSGILAAFGAAAWYMEKGFCEEMYRYIGIGAAEMVLLYVISQLSDEQYKIEAAKNYMVDYLENVCAQRRRKTRQTDKELINVIHPEGMQSVRGKGRSAAGGGKAPQGKYSAAEKGVPGRGKNTKEAEAAESLRLPINIEGEPHGVTDAAGSGREAMEASGGERGRIVAISGSYEGGPGIETETMGDYTLQEEICSPKDARYGMTAEYKAMDNVMEEAEEPEKLLHSKIQERGGEEAEAEERSVMKEEAIRQILEEFLA